MILLLACCKKCSVTSALLLLSCAMCDGKLLVLHAIQHPICCKLLLRTNCAIYDDRQLILHVMQHPMWIASQHVDEMLPLKSVGSCLILIPVSGLLSLLRDSQSPALLAIP